MAYLIKTQAITLTFLGTCPSGKWAPKFTCPDPKLTYPVFLHRFIFGKSFYKLTSICTCLAYNKTKLCFYWTLITYCDGNKTNKWSNSLRAFIIFLILLCLFTFSLDGISFHPNHAKPNSLGAIVSMKRSKLLFYWHLHALNSIVDGNKQVAPGLVFSEVRFIFLLTLFHIRFALPI